MKRLDITLFLTQLKPLLSNQVLRKLVKHHNLVNVNSKELLYLQRAPFGVFFFTFIAGKGRCNQEGSTFHSFTIFTGFTYL